MNETPTDHPVVVGVRNHQTGLLSFARGVAGLLGSRLRVVHSYSLPFPYAHATLYTSRDPSSVLTPASQQVIDDARTQLEAAGEGPEVEYDLVYGYPPAVLALESYEAAALVIGTDDIGWLDRASGAAVTRHLCAHAGCPVVVVPPSVDSFRIDEVLVMVDGETAAQGPLRFAFEVAARASVDVRALHVERHLDSPADAEAGQAMLAELLAGWSHDYPDVHVSTELATGEPVGVALRMAGEATLIVAGQPHPGRRGGWRVPVARALAGAGDHTVAIVPSDVPG